MTESRVILPRIIDYACGCGARLHQVRDGGEPNLYVMWTCSQHTPVELGEAMDATLKEREATV